jgi:hypothetical protein
MSPSAVDIVTPGFQLGLRLQERAFGGIESCFGVAK